ncbi:MAG: hypothetical protein KAI66_27980, partial [Lentisphaeria bacterium]|nr:hypothetical protein [Lentisphaeria bacterium]
SWHPAGQELASLVGLSLWNYRIVQGLELEAIPVERPVPEVSAVREPAPPLPEGWPSDPFLPILLAKLDWDSLLAHHSGWTWNSERQTLLCPDGRLMKLTTVEHQRRGKRRLIFTRAAHGCEACEPRPTCFTAKKEAAGKHFYLRVSAKLADPLAQRLAATRLALKTAQAAVKTSTPGPWEPIGPRFLPAKARSRYREIFLSATLYVKVSSPGASPPRPVLLVDSDAERQQRRQTWAQKVAANASLKGTKIWMDVYGRGDLRARVESGGALAMAG